MSVRFYGTREWRRLAAKCLALSPACAVPGCGLPAAVADHIIPRSKGGSDRLDNLRPLCAGCHNARRGTAEPRAKGAHADGRPRDTGHWWNAR